ncbi:hypothetical protein B0T16DRAFT_487856 [Cercophora newfieldiana]|uniref:Uncharacterized protein n=1 Tax=Cercophora newfieldiana TaxID=92897 RepID=A0AA39YRT1_9PEZI|nr:hypothetical protein B0T16DRAFT_487856 [Cercophora newfieldiana]
MTPAMRSKLAGKARTSDSPQTMIIPIVDEDPEAAARQAIAKAEEEARAKAEEEAARAKAEADNKARAEEEAKAKAEAEAMVKAEEEAKAEANATMLASSGEVVADGVPVETDFALRVFRENEERVARKGHSAPSFAHTSEKFRDLHQRLQPEAPEEEPIRWHQADGFGFFRPAGYQGPHQQSFSFGSTGENDFAADFAAAEAKLQAERKARKKAAEAKAKAEAEAEAETKTAPAVSSSAYEEE